MHVRILVFFLLTGSCFCQQLSPEDRIAADDAATAMQVNHVRAHIAFLSDSLLEGRAPGTRGYDIAARYVATQLDAMGLQPAGDRGGWFQKIPFRDAQNDNGASSLQLSGSGKELKLHDGVDYVYPADTSRTKSEVRAPVVFVGYGVTAPELNYDDYKGVDVKGKIVAAFENAPPRFPAAERAYYSYGDVKGKNAVAHGAIGMLVFFLPVDEKRKPWSWVVPQIQKGDREWLDPSGTPHDALPEIRGWALLSHHSAETLFEGAPTTLQQAIAAAEVSQSQAFPLQWMASMTVVSSHKSIESANVVGKLVGSDPNLRDQYVIYTAHLDHLGICPPVDGDNICHGALDNASGVATLLEIARAYTRLAKAPKRSVLFLFVTGEEVGREGSDYFAHFPTIPSKGMIADLNIDVPPGLRYPCKDVVAIGGEHSNLRQNLEVSAHQVGYEISPDPSPEELFFVRSDQYSFVKQGVPSLWLRNGVDGVDVVKKWLVTRYHTPSDNMEQQIYYEAGIKAAKLYFVTGYSVAQQSEPPAWNAGDFFGRTFGHAEHAK